MGRREELHKKIIEVNIQMQKLTLEIKENFLEQREIVNGMLIKVKDCFKDSEGKINEALFDLNAEQITLATRALQYIDTALKYLEKNNPKKALLLMDSVKAEIKGISKISDQMLKASKDEE